MTLQIWEFVLPDLSPEHTVTMPVGASILNVGVRDDQAVMWAVVDTDADVVERKFAIVATGEDVPNVFYEGTFQVGVQAWHVFELRGGLPG